MKPITVLPNDAAPKVEALLAAAGWKGRSSKAPADGRAPAALDVVRRGDPVLAVPADARATRKLRRILVVHKGSRGDRAGMDAADEAAVASGARIIVLHIPRTSPSSTTGSMPFRMADHGTYDWSEWREEFLRRFCRCSPGVRVELRVASGTPAMLGDQVREERPDLVIVSGVRTFDTVRNVGLPVLIVPGIGHERAARRGQQVSA
ncbi:MAG TPA: universal stress protein [Candidatus Limnocylindrales bacterium]|nr:universal stress protein [Candidatus Limnocylindrales bacterium]